MEALVLVLLVVAVVLVGIALGVALARAYERDGVGFYPAPEWVNVREGRGEATASSRGGADPAVSGSPVGARASMGNGSTSATLPSASAGDLLTLPAGCRRVRPVELRPGDVVVVSGALGAVDPVVTGEGYPYRSGPNHWWGVPTSLGCLLTWKLETATRFDVVVVRIPDGSGSATPTVGGVGDVAAAGPVPAAAVVASPLSVGGGR